jgi:predicted  nucleic acid-binding Zn-ribbon protein
VEAKEQLKRLLRIQDLALDIRRARAVVEGAPARIEDIEARFRERNAEYVAIQARHDELDCDQKARTQSLAELEEARRKFTDQLMQVKNQREYAAVLKEIDAVKAHAAEHEDAVLKAMDELETLTSDLDSRDAHIQEERTKVASEVADVEREAEVAAERADQSEGERAAIEVELLRDLVDAVRRVEEARSGIFLAKAEGQVCQSCYVRIRPQVFQEIKLAARIHSCGNCRRFLYYEPALRAEAAAELPVGNGQVTATHGGSV